jgi:hypothetical protein
MCWFKRIFWIVILVTFGMLTGALVGKTCTTHDLKSFIDRQGGQVILITDPPPGKPKRFKRFDYDAFLRPQFTQDIQTAYVDENGNSFGP